ncbi:hypothetical protein Tco_0365976 [Tanacetum coccineum]
MNRIRCFKTTWFVVDVALKPTTIPLSLLAEHGRYKCRVEQYLDWRWFLSNERRYALWHHHFLKDSVAHDASKGYALKQQSPKIGYALKQQSPKIELIKRILESYVPDDFCTHLILEVVLQSLNLKGVVMHKVQFLLLELHVIAE